MAVSLALSDFARCTLRTLGRIGESARAAPLYIPRGKKLLPTWSKLRRRHETILNERMRGITGTLGLTAAEYRNPQMYLVKD